MNQDSRSMLTNKSKQVLRGFLVFIVVFFTVWILNNLFFGPSQKNSKIVTFEIPNKANLSLIAQKLEEDGLIKNRTGFVIASALQGGKIISGQYRISGSMTAWGIAKTLHREPALRRVVIPEGLRKEQVANLLAERLNWTEEQTKKWVTTYTALKYDYLEGVYFPETYLIPISESPLGVAKRLQRIFEEKMKPYLQEATSRDIQWTTVLTMASLVQREAAGKQDAALIAGILWNRLRNDMPLEVDSTVQYARDSLVHYGQTPGEFQLPHYSIRGGWWSAISTSDKTIDSPFNTYLYKGLPPHPIANPGIISLEAALHPAATECIYYLHDSSKDIHCAKSLSEHENNVAKHLHSL